MGSRSFRSSRGGQRRVLGFIGVLGVALLALGTVGIEPAFADQAITSAGPLTNIGISSDLNCSVNHTGDTAGEFYGNTACATEIAIPNNDGSGTSTVYGPASIPAGNEPGGFNPVSQTGVTGSGTNVDPYKIVTVVDVGTTGIQITETDSYVVGQESYRTDVQVANTTGAGVSAQLYRGGDCYLQNSDTGFGAIGNPPGAVACVAEDLSNPGNPGTRIEQWLPLTGGSHYYEAYYNAVWAAMSSGNPFPDTCDCTTLEDNGAGLSWAITVPAHGSVTESHLTTFSPAGNLPLSTSKTADSGSVDQGGQDGYTITISNPNTSTVSLNTITDTLPAGFDYVTGSTTGGTTADPSTSSGTLTWNGPFSVPAASNQTPGTLSLHFLVTANASPGTYFNSAGGTADTFTIVPIGDTAPVVVNPTTTTTTSTTTSTSTTTTTAPTTTTSTSTTTTTAPTTTTSTSTTTTTAPTTTTSTSTTTTTAPTTTTSTSTTTTGPPTTCKPGYGYGDTNHCHSGPPGPGDHGGSRFRLIDVRTSAAARWTIILAGALLLGLAIVMQRRLRHLR